MSRLIRRASPNAVSGERVSASVAAIALCISTQSICIWPSSRFESENVFGTSTSLRVSTGRASTCGQDVRGRSRAAPQAGDDGVGRARPTRSRCRPAPASSGTW